jgi:hypothetical protein
LLISALCGLLLGGCATLSEYLPSWVSVKTAQDFAACAASIAAEVTQGQADPALVKLGLNPTFQDVIAALQAAISLLPNTVVGCAQFAADFDVPTAPITPVPPATAATGGKAPNPWHQPRR